jgi:hypothetical protein
MVLVTILPDLRARAVARLRRNNPDRWQPYSDVTISLGLESIAGTVVYDWLSGVAHFDDVASDTLIGERLEAACKRIRDLIAEETSSTRPETP